MERLRDDGPGRIRSAGKGVIQMSARMTAGGRHPPMRYEIRAGDRRTTRLCFRSE